MPSATGSVMLRLELKAVEGHRGHDAGAFSNGLRTSRSVLDCASPLALFLREPAGVTEKAARCWPRQNELKAACRVEATCLVIVKRRREHRRKLTLPNFPRKLRAWRKRPLRKTAGLTCRSARTRSSASAAACASWPNACATFAPDGKRTALARWTRLRRPRPAVDDGKTARHFA